MPTRVETLNEMTQLKQSGFGQHWPRHGLKLLYWFSTKCVSFDESNEMECQCDPEDGDFGFHCFANRCDRNGVKLLPDVEFPYYVVGNLNSGGADELPDDITEDYTGELDNSNTDRIIVSLDDKWFDKVYITTHTDESDYDTNNTYRISKGLILTISHQQSMKAFLREMGFRRRPTDRFRPPGNYYVQAVSIATNTTPDCKIDIKNTPAPQNKNAQGQTQSSTERPGFWSFCTIL